MYSLSQIQRGLRNPRRILMEVNRLFDENVRGINRIAVMEEDWDTLVILDGCRYDLFSEVNDIPGVLNAIISRGSSTRNFLENNFDDKTYFDTLYVSANPQLELHGFIDQFYDVIPLWKDEWDPDLRTVKPDRVTNMAIETYRDTPHKRLIVHYVQPHFPFIGESGRELEHRGFAKTPGNLEETKHMKVWDQLKRGELSRKRVWDAYRENLELTLPEVKRLIENVPGKTVVTSDHGNALGEMGVYGHPGNRYVDALVRVPWLIVESGERREIHSENKHNNFEYDTSSAEDRLEDLGYKV